MLIRVKSKGFDLLTDVFLVNIWILNRVKRHQSLSIKFTKLSGQSQVNTMKIVTVKWV
jgi:hypothetical protein